MNTERKPLTSAHWLIVPVAALALLLFAGRPAQGQTKPKGEGHATMPMADESMVMKNGKMMMMEGGKLKPMTMNMTMSDGTLCMTDGTCKSKDGTITKMKEGDHCMMENGKMVIHPGSKAGHKKAGAKMGKMKMKG
ncbi:MAG: hypothetical protein LH609_23540 [Rudanella sp.]|nr:hypothetical protein [Rudanella sp.]